jgi:hypothetical protein
LHFLAADLPGSRAHSQDRKLCIASYECCLL